MRVGQKMKQLFSKLTVIESCFKKLWILQNVHCIYGSDTPRKQTKLYDDQKLLRDKIAKKSKEIKLLGIFSSMVSGTAENVYHMGQIEVKDIQSLLLDSKKLTQRNYELKRERATEAMVFLVADLDRSWEKDQIRCAPVCWFPKGYSLSTENLRQIVEEVHTQCHRNGIHTPCQSFDGQWHVLVTRTKDGKPSTLFQLQKDVWKEVEQMRKNDIMAEFKSMNRNVTCIRKRGFRGSGSEKCRTNTIELTNGNIRLPVYRETQKTNKESEIEEHESASANPTAGTCNTLADVIPDNVKDARELDDRVLAMSSIEDPLEMEAFSGNIGEEEWVNELEQAF